MSERGVSVTVDYVILFMIATVVLAGIATVSGVLIEDQVDRGVEDELAVTGERLAADIQDVEHLFNASDVQATTIELRTDLPSQVSGESYSISISEEGPLELRAPSRDITVQTTVAASRLEPTDSRIAGGPVLITAENGSIEVGAP